MRRKAVHVVLLVVVVPCAVLSGRPETTTPTVLLAFWVAGVTEAVLGSASVGEACKEVGKVTGRWLLGIVGIVVLFLLSVGGL